MYLTIINVISFIRDRREIVKTWGESQQGAVQYCCDYFLYLYSLYTPYLSICLIERIVAHEYFFPPHFSKTK